MQKLSLWIEGFKSVSAVFLNNDTRCGIGFLSDGLYCDWFVDDCHISLVQKQTCC